MSRLEKFPVSAFSITMGLTGLSLAWRKTLTVLGADTTPSFILAVVAAVIFAVTLALYLIRAITLPAAFRADIAHPIKPPFQAAITVSFLLLAAAFQNVAPEVASVLWWIGAVGHLALTLFFINRWSFGTDLTRVLPTWLIPLVANVMAPLAGVKVGSVGLSWAMFGLGVGLWFAMFPLIIARYVLHGQPQPPAFAPTIAILIAPPAVGLVALDTLLPGIINSPVGFIIAGMALAFFMSLLANAPTIAQTPFGLPWWALTFPTAAFSTMVMALASSHSELMVPGLVLVGLTTVLIGGIAVRTIVALARHETL